MATTTLSRRTKAIVLAPLAVLSGVWTASLVSTSATASSADSSTTDALPDGTRVPEAAIQAPASVAVPGVIAPAVPRGAADAVVSGASSNGIPAPALSAYQRGAQIIDAADTSCNIPWELIAAIGRVESDHGRYGGNTLTENGVSRPGIYGIALNGRNGTQAVGDTDGGQLDKDPVHDRAVGPMQFIPSTWQVVKVDADGDGQRNPQDLDDAALATAVYLCSGEGNLSTRKGQEAAVYRYHHSQDYVNLVLRLMEAYSSGDYTALPSGVDGGSSFSSSGYSAALDPSSRIAQARKAKQQRHAKAARAARAARADGTAGTSSGGAAGGTASGSTGGTGADGGTGGVGGVVGGGGSSGSASNKGSLKDTVTKVTKGVGGAVGGAVGGVVGGGGSSTPKPTPKPSPKPDPSPTPKPDPAPQITRAVASTRCLAEVGVSSIAALLGGKLTQYHACMARYGY